jgi:hypothetical protein
VHNQKKSFVVVDLLANLSCSKRLCNSKNQLFYVTWQNFVRMSATVPPPLTWHICRIIVDSLGPIMSTCILNQSRGHWLLSDALNCIISMSLKFKDEIDSATFDNVMEKDGNVAYDLSCLASNIKKEVI